MDATEFARVQSLFDAALERPTIEREAYVREACADDDTLREHVLRLLRVDSAPAESQVKSAVQNATLSFAADAQHKGVQLGPYRLIRELGRGGMGNVWLAERADDAYRAKVAIKIVRGGFVFPDQSRRFRTERQILADVRHPNIAALLDGGESDDGTPYLVMEYIDGEPITVWAESHRASLAERLRVFRLVCEAVQHAHNALVVHRDIKPSNILVGSDGTPKLLDFGIAKLLTPDSGAETTALTRRLTPWYASPEQIRGDRITVASDVYSLGVLLYELLVGAHPFAADGASAEEVRRSVLEQEPAKPSDALRQRPSTVIHPRDLAGDLDNIIAKAMRKEPERRYASVGALVDDIERMLEGRPVRAQPASVGHRARKFIARNAAAVTGISLIFLSLISGLGATMWQARRADRARTRAESALSRAAEVQKFLTGIFGANAPNQSLGTEITARQLLERGAKRIDSLTGQPQLQAYLLQTIGGIEFTLGNDVRAKAMYDRALDIRRALNDPPDTTLIHLLNIRGQLYYNLGVLDSAAASYREALGISTKLLGAESPSALAALSNIGGVYFRLGQDRGSEAALRQVIAAERRLLPFNDGNRSITLCNLALHLGDAGRYADAEPLFQECLAIRIHLDSLQQRPTTATALSNYGGMLLGAGRIDEAEPYLARALAIHLKTLGPRHRATSGMYLSYGMLLSRRGRPTDFVRADSLLRAALDVRLSLLGPRNPGVARPLHELGVLALNRGEPRAAEEWFRQALAIRRLGQDAPRETVRTLVELARAQVALGDAAAMATVREADSLARARVEEGDPVRSRAAIGLALAEVRRGNRADGARQYGLALKALADRVGDEHPLVKEACAEGTLVDLDGGAECP